MEAITLRCADKACLNVNKGQRYLCQKYTHLYLPPDSNTSYDNTYEQLSFHSSYWHSFSRKKNQIHISCGPSMVLTIMMHINSNREHNAVLIVLAWDGRSFNFVPTPAASQWLSQQILDIIYTSRKNKNTATQILRHWYQRSFGHYVLHERQLSQSCRW